jgi:molecular chaperone DnaK
MSNTVYGIDLGTTYSAIARVSEIDDTLAEILRNKDNEAVTPSVVLFDGDTQVVGAQAKNKARLKPERTAMLFKRDMGSDMPTFGVDGKEYFPHELSALVLGKLVKDVQENEGEEVTDVIITCPAYFGFTERAATRRAGEIAGLHVLGIINEPTAAAYHYGVRLGEGAPEETFLVYDLGGGTFDVSVVRAGGDRVRVVTSHGSKTLGGADWDNAIVDHIAERFLEQNPSAEDPRNNERDAQELLTQVERAKRALTESDQAEVFVLSGAERAEVTIDRATFDELTSAMLNETINYAREAVREAEEAGFTIDKVLLVGGSSKMPQVTQRVESEFGLLPEMREPDLAVAKGAALAAQHINELREAEEAAAAAGETGRVGADGQPVLAGQESPFQDICPWSFGILTRDRQTKQDEVTYMIERNHPIPASITKTFSTESDDQTGIRSGIYQQRPGAPASKVVADNDFIAEFVVEGLPPGYPADTPVDVTFAMDSGGLITVVASHPGLSAPAKTEVRVELAGPTVEESREKMSGSIVAA